MDQYGDDEYDMDSFSASNTAKAQPKGMTDLERMKA